MYRKPDGTQQCNNDKLKILFYSAQQCNNDKFKKNKKKGGAAGGQGVYRTHDGAQQANSEKELVISTVI